MPDEMLSAGKVGAGRTAAIRRDCRPRLSSEALGAMPEQNQMPPLMVGRESDESDGSEAANLLAQPFRAVIPA
jgi:hypothetical protein